MARFGLLRQTGVGYIDRYLSWFLSFPAGEFCAGTLKLIATVPYSYLTGVRPV